MDVDKRLVKTLRRDLSWLLDYCPFDEQAKIISYGENNVLCVGDMIPQRERTFLRETISRNPRARSGSVGAMIFYVAPKTSPDAFCINTVGVEEAYLHEGYATRMVKWGERAAQALYLAEVHIQQIGHPLMRRIAERRGYAEPPHDRATWVKYISDDKKTSEQ